MPASEFSETLSPSSPVSDTSHAYSLDKKVGDGFSTLEVVPPSNLEHYKRLSEVTRSYNPNVPPSGQDGFPGANNARSDSNTTPRSDAPSTSADEKKRPTSRITICGMPQRAFWIVFGVIATLMAIGIIVGGTVGGIHKNEAVPTVTAVVTVTYTPTKTTTSSTSQTYASAVTTTAVCVAGYGQGNYVGLCSFACNYGYCPAGPCTCTSSGTPIPTPATNGINGVPLSGEDESYLGLCSFCCNHGYCPSSACTTSAS